MSASKRKSISIEEQRLRAQQWRDNELSNNKRNRTRSKSPGAPVNTKSDIEEQRLRAKLWSEAELQKGKVPVVQDEVVRSPIRSPIRSPMRPQQQQQQRGREIFTTSISASPKRPLVTSKPSTNSFRKPSPSPSRVKYNTNNNSNTKSTTYTTYIRDIHTPTATAQVSSNTKFSRQKGPFTIEDTETERFDENQDDGYAFSYVSNDVVSSDDGSSEIIENTVTQHYGRDSKEKAMASADTTKKGKYDGYIVLFFLSIGFGFSVLHYCYEKAGPAIQFLQSNYIPATITTLVVSLSVGGIQLYLYRSNRLRIRKCAINRIVHLIVSLLGNVPEDYLDGYPIDFLAHDVIQEIQNDSWEPSSDVAIMYNDIKSNPKPFIEGAWKDIKLELTKDNRIKTLDRLVDGKQHKCYKLRGIRATVATNAPKQTSPTKLFHY